MLVTPVIIARAADQFQPDVPISLVERLDKAKVDRMAGKTEQALADIRLIVKEYPDYYRAQYNLGLALAEASGSDNAKLGEAIATLEKAREIRERKSLQDYSIYNSIGWYYAQANRPMDAEAAYKKAVEHSNANTQDTNRRVYTNLGIFYLERGDLKSARKYLQTAADTYHSETARKFLEINEVVQSKMEISDQGLTYRAKFSDQDKSNSKGVRFVDDIRKTEGPQTAVLETLLQDRANYYQFGKRDAEDQPSAGLESTSTNRLQLQKRRLEFVGITADECLDQQPVVTITITKDTIRVSKP
jgi:tetratricopeptide (TPR) repeat protein